MISMPDLTIDDIVNFYVDNKDRIESLLKSESQLVELSGDKIVIVGDLHGDYISLQSILSRYRPPEWKILFLGDYVDRGEYQIETLTRVLMLKLEYPEHVYMLRGNHESPYMNLEYGFIFELQSKLEDKSYLIYMTILKSVYCNLPYAALVNNEIFAVHGGLARGLAKPEEVKQIPKCDEQPKDPIAFQILWNDPSDEVQGFVPNYLRGGCIEGGLCIYWWGQDVTEEFLTKNNLKMIVRAHEYNSQGYKWNHNKKVLTIFTSKSGPYSFVEPKILIIEKNDIKIRNARQD